MKIRQPEQKTPGILFLDMDGVLITNRTCHGIKTINDYHVDPIGVQMIDDLCAIFNLQIVVFSCWRAPDHAQIVLKACGMKAAFHKNADIPVMGADRGDEIYSWLEAHPEIKKFIILTSAADDISYINCLRARTIQTDQENGILWQHYLAAQKLLTEMGADQ